VQEISQALADNVNPTLFKLDFFKARLGDQGIQTICNGLKVYYL
jgi:hypothetical protein